MALRLLPVFFVAAALVRAQAPCAPTPAYGLCEIVFDLNDSEAAAHANPYLSIELHAEFRSPRHRTYLMPGFWDGGRRLVIRFSPTDAGEWDFRITSNLARFSGKQGKFMATASNSPGFLRPANVHHWMYTESRQPHLWMGDTSYRFAVMERTLFEQMVDRRAAQKFNHIRGLVLGGGVGLQTGFQGPDLPDAAHFRELDYRIRYMNSKGIFADLVLAGDENHLADLFPTWQQRERYIRYLVARYSSMHITWQGVQEFEEYARGRELLKEIGDLLKRMDPYQHPRSSHAVTTSSPLLADGWMDYIVYQTSNDSIGAIERQLYAAPMVNAEFAYEDSGAGRSHSHHVDTDTFRRRLWNATMNGHYPTFGNTGVYGGRKFTPDARYLESPGAAQMTVWFDFFSRTRYWELQPFFDVDGGRAVALPGIEYIVYLEKPGPVELITEKHSYDVYWVNPVNGQVRKERKRYKGDRFRGEPPDQAQDWVLHLSRDGRKESMLRSYRFESRPTLMQEVELNPSRVPFEIVEPAGETLPVGKPVPFEVKVTRDTRATRSMMYVLTGEVSAEGQGFRVLATGAKGELRVPPKLASDLPAVINLRLVGLNANGKAYSINRVFRLTQ